MSNDLKVNQNTTTTNQQPETKTDNKPKTETKPNSVYNPLGFLGNMGSMNGWQFFSGPAQGFGFMDSFVGGAYGSAPMEGKSLIGSDLFNKYQTASTLVFGLPAGFGQFSIPGFVNKMMTDFMNFFTGGFSQPDTTVKPENTTNTDSSKTESTTTEKKEETKVTNTTTEEKKEDKTTTDKAVTSEHNAPATHKSKTEKKSIIAGSSYHQGETVGKNHAGDLIKKYTDKDGKRIVEYYDKNGHMFKKQSYTFKTIGNGDDSIRYTDKKQTEFFINKKQYEKDLLASAAPQDKTRVAMPPKYESLELEI